MDRHVFKNDEFMAMALESDSHQGLGTHSFQKGAADKALGHSQTRLKSEDGGSPRDGE